ncbi:hypothetical protein [Rhizobium laguerreae]|uniref:Uncharacterized protein n=1 Tax=Rhizobium laguerreae TaxID=1076926 RepID=A0A7Y2R1C8_9HYPH|nr:hypothetical protein [Rhizobium laguerreae]NNH62534.1 hypothetical protein [Rhizobium laguerreae]
MCERAVTAIARIGKEPTTAMVCQDMWISGHGFSLAVIDECRLGEKRRRSGTHFCWNCSIRLFHQLAGGRSGVERGEQSSHSGFLKSSQRIAAPAAKMVIGISQSLMLMGSTT